MDNSFTILLKVFLRESLDKYLTKKLLVIENKAVITIQTYFRMYLARKKYIKMRLSAIALQKYFRGFIQR